MSKYQALIDALEAPGLSDCPWDAFGPSNDAAPPDYYNEVVAVRGDAQVQVICHAPRGLDGARTADATYIAEANPSTIRALLADLERAEKALREVVAVFDSNPSSICDTVWVTGNRPETLYDYCQDALAQMAGGGEMACPRCGCKETYQYDEEDAPDDSFQRCAACGVIFSLDDETPEDEGHP